jgi:RHS repeat-associated protein
MIQTQYSYEPFGNTTITGAASGNVNEYTGRELDETGIYFYRARYYNPTTGRFLSEDPIGFGGSGTNLYAYSEDNPIGEIDPWGLQTTVIIWNPVGYGESSLGHASIDIDGTTYSYGPNGMTIVPSDQYDARNEVFRNGLGDDLDLTPDQENNLRNYLKSYRRKYHALTNNCIAPIREGLKSVGINLASPVDPYILLPPLVWTPSDLEWALEHTNNLVSGWTTFAK